jgi:hypothetical protein
MEGACPTQQPNAGTTRHKEAQAAMCIRRGCQTPLSEKFLFPRGARYGLTPPRCGANKALEVFPSAASALALASSAAVRALKYQDDPDMDAVTPFQHNPSSVQLVSIDCAPRFRAVQCQSIANFLVSMACGFGLFP